MESVFSVKMNSNHFSISTDNIKRVSLASVMDIKKFIKTDCGRTKYYELSKKKGLASKIRLGWFIIIATIKDWNLPS